MGWISFSCKKKRSKTLKTQKKSYKKSKKSKKKSKKIKNRKFGSFRRFGSRRRFGKGSQYPGLNSIMGNYRPLGKMNTFQGYTGMSDSQRDAHYANIPNSLRSNFYV